MQTERVHFRLVRMGCCNTLLCLVNPRLYNYCPECGKHCYSQIKQWILGDYPDAMLKYKEQV